MKTAKLHTEAFSITCPHCKEAQVEKKSGSQMFTPEDVEPGQSMVCTSETCKETFRLPTTLRAEVQNS